MGDVHPGYFYRMAFSVESTPIRWSSGGTGTGGHWMFPRLADLMKDEIGYIYTVLNDGEPASPVAVAASKFLRYIIAAADGKVLSRADI